ncbi:MAG: ribonuclease H [Candidatus Gracilibacteria bacterium]
MTSPEIEIYTDGSCKGNPGPGGWAFISLHGDKQHKASGHEPKTTNNRMEMMAMIEALKWVWHDSRVPDTAISATKIHLYSDSNLLVQTINQGWKRKANLDLWSELDRLREWLTIDFIWVKAHHTNKYNNAVDKMALKAAGRKA